MPALGTAYLGESYIGGHSDVAEEPVFPTGLAGLVDSTVEEFIAKQGDSGPAWVDHLTYSNGSLVNLKGCTVHLVMRSLSSRQPVQLTGQVEIPDPATGEVLYTPSSNDTASYGDFMAVWVVTYPSGSQMTFPTVGYRTVRIEENLTAEDQELVSLGELKDYLNIPPDDRAHDAKLMSFIRGIRPLIEVLTGPIIPRQFDEWYDGGHPWVTLRHRPRAGTGTTPILNVMACSEYLGPVEWPLAIIASPDEGQLYSCMVDLRLGRVVRRTAGGGTQPFPYQPQAVHVVYEAGQEQVPENVRLAALETIREAYDTTQAVGRGRRTVADEQETSLSLAQAFSIHGKRLLAPTRKGPAFA